MTAKRTNPAQRHAAVGRLSTGSIAFLLMAAISFFLILFCSETATGAMKHSLTLCAETVVPALFPFMVVSELIVASGAATALGKLLAPLFRRLFGVGGAGGSAILLGFACGFPIGTKSAVGLYDAGSISRGDLCYLLCVCNQPSSAFVTGVVGVSLFGSYRFGLLLYGLTLASGLAVGLVLRCLLKKDEYVCQTERANAPQRTGVSRFTDAVAGSARGMLTVCAFVCFFGTLVACLSSLPAVQALPPVLSALTVGFFELTGGVSQAAACTPPALAAYASAWCLGWSGLSVHFQILSLCDRAGLSFRPYFAAKAAQGVLNVTLLAAAFRLWPNLVPKGALPSVSLHAPHRAWPLSVGLLALATLVLVARWGKRYANAQKICQNSHREERKEGEIP